MAQHNELGKLGEAEAARFFEEKGYKILHQNWRCEGYEIDIVAQDSDFIVFAEVKTRTSAQWGDPQDAVGRGRVKRMVEAADCYIRMYDIDLPARFDIVAVVWTGKKFVLEHIDDAFLPPVNV